MGMPAKESVVMRDFSGMASKPDSDDLTPGAAQVQVNVMSSRPGELRTRQGYQQLSFEGQ